MIYQCIEISEGSLSGTDIVTTAQEAVDWANKVLTEYGSDRKPFTVDDLLEEDLYDIELPGDEMGQSRLHIISKNWT